MRLCADVGVGAGVVRESVLICNLDDLISLPCVTFTRLHTVCRPAYTDRAALTVRRS
jgi:hypothetical protein